jgi:hypothetical protein
MLGSSLDSRGLKSNKISIEQRSSKAKKGKRTNDLEADLMKVKIKGHY